MTTDEVFAEMELDEKKPATERRAWSALVDSDTWVYFFPTTDWGEGVWWHYAYLNLPSLYVDGSQRPTRPLVLRWYLGQKKIDPSTLNWVLCRHREPTRDNAFLTREPSEWPL